MIAAVQPKAEMPDADRCSVPGLNKARADRMKAPGLEDECVNCSFIGFLFSVVFVDSPAVYAPAATSAWWYAASGGFSVRRHPAGR